ncbi:heavy metal-binding domain-containing protein [Anatilimnocola sp. NA78]|uniref:heavy metal-binding domain-containing protein n=1 Tax=Anatilimnocola sp. NA78 TaxID=3415683 RepID=UPI003CE46999
MLITGLSGNELYCLAQKGWAPGGIVVGNSVQSLGFVGSLSSSFKTLSGGEIENLTQLITEGRHAALARMEQEAKAKQAGGITGVMSDLKQIGGMQEFIAVGSAVESTRSNLPFFTSACTGQDLYCQLDAGYEPRHFVMGNIAYAMGVGRGIMGALRGMAGGEVKEYSQMYNHTRHLALQRLEQEAAACGANAVVDIHTKILSFGVGAREMLMVGTASVNHALHKYDRPVTSELTGEELWNLAQLGYQPLRLLLGTSVYSIGISQGIGAIFSGLSRGEVNAVTRLIYEARENCLGHIHREATDIKADAVIGTKLFIHEIGASMVEVLAIGTAVVRNSDVKTATEMLLPQAIIRDRDTFIDATLQPMSKQLDRQ